jgi:hypothetical protein
LDASELLVSGTDGLGMLLLDATSSCQDCVFTDNLFAGVAAAPGVLQLTDTSISGTGADPNLGGGYGIAAGDLYGLGEDSAVVSVEGGLVEDSGLAAAYLVGPGTYLFSGTDLAGSEAVSERVGEWRQGDAVLARDGVTAWDEEGSTGLLLESVTLRASGGAGVFLDASSATVRDVDFEDNELDLVQQGCSGVDEPVGLDDGLQTVLCPDYDYTLPPPSFDVYLTAVEAAL